MKVCLPIKCTYIFIQSYRINDAQRTKKAHIQYAGSADLDQAAQFLRFPLTESMAIVVYVDEQKMTRSDCMDALADLDLRHSHMA